MTTCVLLAFVAVLAVELALEGLNLRHLRRHGEQVPAPFAGAVAPDLPRRTAAYTADNARLGMIEALAGALLFLIFLYGLLPCYDRWIASLTGSFVLGGVLFLWGLLLAKIVLGLPFDLYRTFRLEERYSFNTTTPRLWLADLVKSTLLSLALAGLLAAGALWLVGRSPDNWWLWIWLLFALFTLLLMYLAPYLIEPLFFKFEPVRKEGLEEGIRPLMEKAGLRVSRVLQVDASRRSRHSNAYFTGIGRVKRIVLFDTLLAQMENREVLAVLAHEVGHWKRRHLLRRLLATEVLSLAAFYLAFRLIAWGGLPALIGGEQASFPAQAVILSFLAGIVGVPLAPFSHAVSRRHEREADEFAVRLTGAPADLADALVKLGRDNLANLHPHPLYAWFHYSHPPLVERVEKLREKSRERFPKDA